MTWIKFALWLCGIYTVYYVLIILWDVVRARKPGAKENRPELTFVEDTEPARPALEQEQVFHPSAAVSSGGVSLKQLFSLAREEAVEYTRPVSFT